MPAPAPATQCRHRADSSVSQPSSEAVRGRRGAKCIDLQPGQPHEPESQKYPECRAGAVSRRVGSSATARWLSPSTVISPDLQWAWGHHSAGQSSAVALLRPRPVSALRCTIALCQCLARSYRFRSPNRKRPDGSSCSAASKSVEGVWPRHERRIVSKRLFTRTWTT